MIMNPDTEEHFPAANIGIINHSIEIKDPEVIKKKLSNYPSLDTEQRLSIIRVLPSLIQQLGIDGQAHLKPLFNEIVIDRMDISSMFLDKLADIIEYLKNQKDFDSYAKNLLIPILIQFLKFDNFKVKQRAGEYLGEIALELNDKDRGDYVLKHVIEMAHDDNNQDNRIVAVQLFSVMSECFGKDLCQQYVGLEILSLGEDSNFKVQKQAIKHIPIIAAVVSPNFFQRLFKFFVMKASDRSNWAIRKSCADIIVSLMDFCTLEQKEEQLIGIFITLLKDSNKWVRISSYKNLGKFIFSLKDLKISEKNNQKLVTQFSKMAESDVNSLASDNQIMFNCAFNFPAVLAAQGPQRWVQDLNTLYEKLLKSNDKRVKKTLSESLHQVARIIGQEMTEKHLFKVVDKFFKDPSDEIKLGMVRNMAEIMHVLSPEKRQSLIGVFQEFQKDQKKWRIRECICKQLKRIAEIYSAQTVFEYVVPILLKFCSDTVYIVRQQAAHQVAIFLEKLEEQPGLKFGLIESIKGFATSPKYTQRQSFLMMCENLVEDPKLFEEHFMESFISLADDKVINVVLVLASIVSANVKHFERNKEFIDLKKKLKAHQNSEVRQIFEDESEITLGAKQITAVEGQKEKEKVDEAVKDQTKVQEKPQEQTKKQEKVEVEQVKEKETEKVDDREEKASQPNQKETDTKKPAIEEEKEIETEKEPLLKEDEEQDQEERKDAAIEQPTEDKEQQSKQKEEDQDEKEVEAQISEKTEKQQVKREDQKQDKKQEAEAQTEKEEKQSEQKQEKQDGKQEIKAQTCQKTDKQQVTKEVKAEQESKEASKQQQEGKESGEESG